MEKLDDGGVTVTEDMDPADAENNVFRRFRYRLPEVLQELYFVATKEGKIKTKTHAAHSKVALKYSVARSKSYISLSTLLTIIPCFTGHVYTPKASDAS